MNLHDSIHANSGTPGARRALPGRRVLWLVAPVVIGILMLALVFNVLTVGAFGDLVVTINDLELDPSNPTEVTAGTVYSFTVTVENTSSAAIPAEAVEFQYRAPEVVVVHISSSVGLCEIGTPGDPDDPSICSLGNMDSGASETITIVVFVPSNLAEGTLLDHDVRAWQFGTEEYPPTNEAHGWMGVTTEADLVISKTDDPDPVIAGDLPESLGGVIDGKLLKYTFTVTNTGPSDALNVVMTDTLPVDTAGEPQVVFLNSTLTDLVGADQCSADPIHPEKVTCELGYMTLSQTISFDILTFVNPDVVQAGEAFHTITNTAQVQSPTTDPITGDNMDEITTTVEAKADLIITKADSPDPVVAGEQVVYTISFVNQGPSTARTVTITDVLPAKFEAIDVDGNPANGINPCVPIDPDDVVTCSVSGDVLTGQTVTLEELKVRGTTQLPGDLDPDEGYGFAIVAKVESAYVLDKGVADFEEPLTNPTNPISNTAYIASETTSGGDWHPDVNPDDNQDTELTSVTAQADLKVSKTDTPDPSLPDPYLTYDPVSNKFVYTFTLTIENLGSSDAAKVVLYDVVAGDATFRQENTPDDIQCVFRDDGVLLCLVGNDPNNNNEEQRGRLNAGSVLTMTLQVEVDPGDTPRTLVNTASVAAIAEDEFPFALGDPNDGLGDIEPADFLDGATPTADPDLTNNTFTETTTVLTGEVGVDKKAYVNRSEARGIDIPSDPLYADLTAAGRCVVLAQDDILVLPGDEIVYCYTITNPGETWLSSITLLDAPDGIKWLNPSNFEVVYPAQPPLRGTITLSGPPAINQTINISTAYNTKAVLAPAGVADDYLAILIARAVTVDFPAGTDQLLVKGTNTALVYATPSTKYSTALPGVPQVFDFDLLHDTLALPVLEDTTKKWNIYEDRDGDGLPSPRDVIEYVVDIPNTGAIEATGVVFTDTLYNYIDGDPEDLRVPGLLINGSVSAAIHVYGRDPVTGRVIDADVQPPDLAFGEDLLLRTLAPTIGGSYLELTYPSAIVLDEEILKGNNPGDDEVHVATRLAIPPKGYLLRFDGVTYDPPIPVIFSLRIRYQVRIKETKYVRLDTIVLNHGWLTYNEMGLFDQRFPDFDPMGPNAYTAANKVANYHAGTPGRAWESYTFPGWPEVPENVEPTNHLGLRFDDYGQLGAAPRDNDDDPTWFKLEREPRRIQLPAIDHEGDWETQIKVQNGGDEDTGAIVFFWGEYSGQCPYSDPGPVGSACKRVLENGVWSLEAQIIPSTAKSAIVYSVDEDLLDQACLAAAYAVNDAIPSVKWREWEDNYEGTGEPIAVIAQRKGPNDHDTVVASAYPGISENMEGSGPPYKYFAPYAMRQYHNLDTEMIIHNSGQGCAYVTLEYQKQDDCRFSYEEDIVQLAPGESVRTRVSEVLGANWLGSIYVEADEPLGIVMDQTSFLPSEDRGALLTYEARPYKLTTDTLFYADLIFREWSGWEASIQVQNLTQHSLPTFVTVEFFDASGNSIYWLGDWVCRAGGHTFYLPAVIDLGMQYAGAAVIQSHGQIDYPGGEHDGQPIFAVVDLKKTKMYDESLPGWRYTAPGEIQGGAYNALAESDKKEASDIMLPFLAKTRDYQGVTSLIAVRNNSYCNDIELKLEVRKGSGTVVSYVTNFWLPAGHIKLIDLASVGSVNPGFIGAGTVEVTNVYQLCDTDGDGHKDMTPTMPSVVVVNEGANPGDVTSVYEGIPFGYHGSSCLVTVSGQVIDEETLKPLEDVSIKVDTVEKDKTDFTGYYEFQVSSSTWGTAFTLDVAKTGYHAWLEDYTLYCDDLVINPELNPEM